MTKKKKKEDAGRKGGRTVKDADLFNLLNVLQGSGREELQGTGGAEGIDLERITKQTQTAKVTQFDRLKKLVKDDKVRVIAGSRPKLYYLTYTGRQLWQTLKNSGMSSTPRTRTEIPNEKARQLNLIALQRFQVKFPVKQIPKTIAYGRIHDDMVNWVQAVTEWKNCVEIVQGIKLDSNGDVERASSVQINVKKIIGENPHQLENLAWEIVRTHSRLLESQGFELGLPQEVGVAEYEVASDIAKEEIREYGYAKGVRDLSEWAGEFVFHKPDDAKSFLDLIDVLPAQNRALHSKLSEAVDELKDIGNRIGELTLNQNVQGRLMLEMSENQKKITEVLEKLLGGSSEQIEEQEQSDPPPEMFG